MMNPQQKVAEAQKNTFLDAMTAIYAAKSLGIDSCPIQGFDPAGYAKVLKLPETLVPTLLFPLGYAADAPMPKRRFSETEIFF
jgi:nitroreductase/dihydropteridine reductase